MTATIRTMLLAIVCIAFGFGLSIVNSTPTASAQQGSEATSHSYQISAFGGNAADNSRYGAYVINTTTGKVWLIRESGGEATPVGRNVR